MGDVFPENVKLCYWGNPILRRETVPIEEPESDALKAFLNKMRERIVEHNGAGLAANQVNCDRRVCLVAFPKEGDFSEVKALINPCILEESAETERYEEGCLSFPGLSLDITRPHRIKVKAFIDGEGERLFEATGHLARIIRHEIDHLDGVVFIDRVSQIKRRMISKQLHVIAREYAE